jgi:hypothetical protein
MVVLQWFRRVSEAASMVWGVFGVRVRRGWVWVRVWRGMVWEEGAGGSCLG